MTAISRNRPVFAIVSTDIRRDLKTRVVVKAGFAAVAFFAVMLAVQGRRLIERSAYVWRLVRAGG